MVSEAPPWTGSKTSKVQSLWGTVTRVHEGLSTKYTWIDGPETKIIHTNQPHISSSTKIPSRHITLAAAMDVSPCIVAGHQAVINVSTIEERRRAHEELPLPLPLRPAYLDAGVEAVLYGPIYGMSTPPAKAQAVEGYLPQTAESTLDQREPDMDRRSLEWRDAYLERVSGGWSPAGRQSSGSTGTASQNPIPKIKKQGSGKPEASIDSLNQLSGDKQAAQKPKDDGQQTTARKRKLSDTGVPSTISLKRLCQGIEYDEMSGIAPSIVDEYDQIPENTSGRCDSKNYKKAGIGEYFVSADTTPTFSEIMESNQPTATVVHQATQPPAPWAEAGIQVTRDRSSELAERDINGPMMVKQEELALEDPRRKHENWKKNAEAVNVEISKNISEVRQWHTNEAGQCVVKRSPLLTALTEVNLQILDGQQGIPDMNIDSPGEKETPQASSDFPEKDREHSTQPI